LAGRHWTSPRGSGPETPAEAILGEADACEAELIVLGGHSEPRFRDAVFGTTATHVVRHGHRPVLIVQDVGLAAYRQMMIAIDDPLDAQLLLSSALAVAPQARITAIHAYSPTLVQTLVGTVEIEQQERRLQRQIQDAFAEAGHDDEIEVQVEMGEVLSVMMRNYEARQPPLLVMGTRARATYLSSRAVDTLFWCPGDLLVIPERRELLDSARPKVLTSPA
jgi:nucleotide-binding universal stress UspA family protein